MRGQRRQQSHGSSAWGERSSDLLFPFAAIPAVAHPCPSSRTEPAKFEGNTDTNMLVQYNSVFLGRLYQGATLSSYLLQWLTTVYSEVSCCLKAFGSTVQQEQQFKGQAPVHVKEPGNELWFVC